ncbi:MAG: transcription antitermination factor NusB [Gammaproteobacteria bacterium]|nr:transcription antitermination factor NusB [Gammaproteobacteria bacterium]
MSEPTNNPSGVKPKPSARRKARKLALQALYQWQIAGGSLNTIETQFRTDNDLRKTDSAYFHELLHEIPANVSDLDAQITPLLDRSKEELGVVELSALRIGAYELNHRREIPYRVIINEGIDLAKVFGAEDSFRYINGVLDRLAKQVRQVETNG